MGTSAGTNRGRSATTRAAAIVLFTLAGLACGAPAQADDALTAEFRDLPKNHGSAAFTFELRFSEDFSISYLTLRDSAFSVTNGQVTGARRLESGKNRRWEIHVVPDDPGNVVVTLPGTVDCGATGAICTADDRPLADPVTTTIPEMPPPEEPEEPQSEQQEVEQQEVEQQQAEQTLAPLTVKFEEGSLPATHDGVNPFTFRIAFSAEPAGDDISRTVRFHVLDVALGMKPIVPKTVSQVEAGSNRRLEVTFVQRLTSLSANDKKLDVTIRISPTESCEDVGAVCTENGRKLSNPLVGVVKGPPALSVGDGHRGAREGGEMDFTVTLSRAVSEPVTVEYATRDKSEMTESNYYVAARKAATAGSDYIPVRGTLTFAPGQTQRSVTVRSLQDTEHEPQEVFLFTVGDFTGPGVWVMDGVVDGTINDLGSDPEPETPVVQPPVSTDPLTARFLNLPWSHDGGAAFSFELEFSEELPLGYKTIRDHLFEVSGGAVTGVRRMAPARNDHWVINVAPDGDGDVTIKLPAMGNCWESFVCTTDGRPLSKTVSETVLGPLPETMEPGKVDRTLWSSTLTVGAMDFVGFIGSANGGSLSSTQWSEDGTSHTVAGVNLALFGYGGERENELQVEVSPTPQDLDGLRLHVGGRSLALSAAAVSGNRFAWPVGAVGWTAGEQVFLRLVRTVERAAPGVGLTVYDAEVREGPDALLLFPVVLEPASSETVTVNYATSDGTATEGVDYEAASDTLTFDPGETEKTIVVPVIDDSHDEGMETLTLTLSQPVGTDIAKGTAEGRIVNSDHMPKAWLARFGRTVAEQVIDAVDARLFSAPTPGTQMTLAGYALEAASGQDIKSFEEREAERRFEALAHRLTGQAEVETEQLGEETTLTGHDLLTRSRFSLTAGTPEGGYASVWAHGVHTRFDGREGDHNLDGEVSSGMLGGDWSHDTGSVGLMLTLSKGEGTYSGAGSGEIESTLTGLYPYGRYNVNRRLSLWSVVGYGTGELTLTPQDAVALNTDMDLVMGALGVRGIAKEAPAEGGLEVSVTSDVMAVRTTSDAVNGGEGGNLAAADASVGRVRLGVQGAWQGLATMSGSTFLPNAEIGVRHDSGDAETGFGIDVGAGLAWATPRGGLSGEVHARGLLTHEASGFSEQGIAGTLTWDARPESERGLSLTLTQTLGAQSTGGMESLLGRGTLEGLAPDEDDDGFGNRQLDLRAGYGFGVFAGRFTATPEAGVTLSDSHREMRAGWRLNLERSRGASLELRVDATRSEARDGEGEPENALMLRVQTRF